MGRPSRPPPRWYAPDPGDWLSAAIDDGPAERARRLAVLVTEAVDGRSLREVQRLTGVDRLTVRNLLDGNSWPDIETVTKLELGLEEDLWPALPPLPPLSAKRDDRGRGDVEER